MNWRELLRDRRLLWGVAAAGGLGLVVFLRRRGGTTASSALGDAKAPGATGSSGGIATFDSTGTDVASWLGNYSGALQQQLDDYGKTLTDSLAAIGQSTTAPGAQPPGSIPAAQPAPRPDAPRSVSVPLGTNIYDWLRQLSRAYSPGLDLNRLRQLNPGIDTRIIWTAQGPGQPKIPTWRPGTGPVTIR
ncbi:MAG TPA: hypothetical protein VFE14_20965 [Micromonosporaceae bacterium]|jgi:hypothetical protein|nr:hypothetical protein [Micromonosporaceae bacterium]